MALFLRAHERRKDGKAHTYWSLVENRRCSDGRIVQRHALYLGALTAAQQRSWQKTAQQFDPPVPVPNALPGLATEQELQARKRPPSLCAWISSASSARDSGVRVGSL